GSRLHCRLDRHAQALKRIPALGSPESSRSVRVGVGAANQRLGCAVELLARTSSGPSSFPFPPNHPSRTFQAPEPAADAGLARTSELAMELRHAEFSLV